MFNLGYMHENGLGLKQVRKRLNTITNICAVGFIDKSFLTCLVFNSDHFYLKFTTTELPQELITLSSYLYEQSLTTVLKNHVWLSDESIGSFTGVHV